jgi:16S rRNA (uracil1498-N3)-methyltransferase
MKKRQSFESYFYHPFTKYEREVVLDPAESSHVVKSFRLEKGDSLEVSNGVGLVRHATLLEADSYRCKIELGETSILELNTPGISLAIGFLKPAALDEFIEACTQLPIRHISLLSTQHSSEFKEMNTEKILQRLQLKSITSLKQAKKAWLTTISGPTPFNTWLDATPLESLILLDPHGKLDLPKTLIGSQECCMIMGPEGGLSPEETGTLLSRGVPALTLGPTRLRAKNVGLYALGVLDGLRRNLN